MASLADLESEMFALFEITPALVCVASKDGYFKKINAAVIEKLEYTAEELYARPISSFIHPDDKEITGETRSRLLDGKPLLNFQNRYVSKHGNVVWLQWTSIYLPAKEIVFAIAKDITDMKKIETGIQEKYEKLESIATHFKSKIEKDKKYVSYQLHEDVAQLVSALKMDVDLIASYIPNLPQSSRKTVEHASVISTMLIKAIQKISFSLSPHMLDDFGLNATLEWLGFEFSILNKIPCTLQIDYDEESLSKEVKIDFFRICQEALTNIIAHADAGSVGINISETGEKIAMSISDDGKGFEIRDNSEGHGIESMRNIASSINGEFEIFSEIGNGTRVSVSVVRTLSEN